MHPFIPVEYWSITRWVFLAGVALCLLYIFVHVVKIVQLHRNPQDRRYAILLLIVKIIAALYPTGVLLKFSGFGPDWLRFYLADFGFPVFVAMTLSALLGPRLIHFSDEKTLAVRYENIFLDIRFKERMLLVAVVLSIAYEAIAGFIHWVNDSRAEQVDMQGVGTFDVIDVVMYVLGAAVAFGCFVSATILLRPFYQKARELDAVLAADRQKEENVRRQEQHRKRVDAQKSARQQSRRK